MQRSVTEQAYAKLNLYLRVTGRRDDGYHLLNTLMAFTEYGDALHAEAGDALRLSIDGPFAARLGKGEDNLVLKAARALQRAAGVTHGAQMVLTKNLPVASGIGGGSADAAAALRALNKLWGLRLGVQALEDIARTLGSDVAACVRSVTARATGIGDVLADAPLEGDFFAVLVNPLVPLATPEVYRRLQPPYSGEAVVDWREGRNDLERAARGMLPVIDEIIAELARQAGCIAARMSGSGATCFALLMREDEAAAAAREVARRWPDYWIKATKLRRSGAYKA